MLKIGDTAPDFTLNDQNGHSVKLSDLTREGELILYFYPNDFSPMCTAEACTFRDSYDDVAGIGAQIVGISPQSELSHQRFSRTFKIPFPLLSDGSKKTIRAYGVDGPMGFGVRRVTFLIDADQIIRNRVVSDLGVTSHARLLQQTLSAAQP